MTVIVRIGGDDEAGSQESHSDCEVLAASHSSHGHGGRLASTVIAHDGHNNVQRSLSQRPAWDARYQALMPDTRQASSNANMSTVSFQSAPFSIQPSPETAVVHTEEGSQARSSATRNLRELPLSQTSETVRLLLSNHVTQASQRSRPTYVQPGSATVSTSSTAYSTPPWSHSHSTLKQGSLSSDEKKSSIYAEKFYPSPHSAVYDLGPEDDDALHDPRTSKLRLDDTGSVFTVRGCLNIGTLIILAGSLLMLFAGYPIMTEFLHTSVGNRGAYGLGGTNATGQLPNLSGMPQLIDPDTPRSAYERTSFDGSKKMKLVFSDEFNKDGRSFYPGDDPFWMAENLHYWGTGNYEWYDPAAVTTRNGNLEITLSEMANHNLNFRGGMISTWNKFCFTGGYIEVRVVLPGRPDVSGLWPAAWTMGNLGRAGYGATNDGMWPYTYDNCDVGTLPNQTWPASMGGGPVAAETTGLFVDTFGPGLSYLPGQRLSRCTCPNYDDHPGPKHPDGSYVGRSSPEIDILEAQASNRRGASGHVSMSLQLAPYDAGYNLSTAPGSYEFINTSIAELNSYTGSVYQQAASGVVTTDDDAYEMTGGKFDTYGFEYKPGTDPDSHITWSLSSQPVWRMNAQGMGPDPRTEIGARSVPYEPMYIILNLGISSSFSYVNFDSLVFPTKYLVDYVRVWQPEGEENIGCDPPSMPTQDYINRHWEAYNNPNFTIWTGTEATGGYQGKIPPNRLTHSC